MRMRAMSEERFVVEHREAESRYVLVDRGEAGTGSDEIGEESYIDFAADGPTQRIFFHTGVSEDYSGQGLASVLVGAAVEHAADTGNVIVPVCPYVAGWFKKHPELAGHAVAVRPEHLRAANESGR